MYAYVSLGCIDAKYLFASVKYHSPIGSKILRVNSARQTNRTKGRAKNANRTADLRILSPSLNGEYHHLSLLSVSTSITDPASATAGGSAAAIAQLCKC